MGGILRKYTGIVRQALPELVRIRIQLVRPDSVDILLKLFGKLLLLLGVVLLLVLV
jgi:hypothetical protein